MPADLRSLRAFPQLVAFLGDDLDWRPAGVAPVLKCWMEIT